MPQELSKDLIIFTAYLLPGFLAAWIFYGLTSHPKPSHFERVIQALIFTFIIQTLIPVFRWIFEQIGHMFVVGVWNSTTEGLTSLVLAVTFGITLAYFTHTDKAHKWLRQKGLTTRTSHPSEWFYVFSEKVTFIILHLRDGRRLYGWPKEWPVNPDSGQFYIMLPSWIDADGEQIELPQLDGVLVNVKDVYWVEFIEKS